MKDKGAPVYLQIIVVIVIITMCYLSIINKKKDKEVLEKRHRYVIGTTLGYTTNHRSSKFFLSFFYRINGAKYSGYVNLTSIKGIRTKDGEYIVKYDPLYPKNCEILFNQPVTFHPSLIEDTGWLIVPGYILGQKSDTLVW